MSSSCDSVVIKQPIRRLEIQINNFNVAIPHHVDLLKQHKNNIKKYEQQHDWEKVRREHINISRIIKQLKELLYQMDTLRAQVLDEDIAMFDKLTATARTNLMTTIEEYLEIQFHLPTMESLLNKHENQEDPIDEQNVQLQAEQELQRQQACLHAWNDLQGDMQHLHQLFVDFNQIVYDQKEQVDNLVDNIETAQENVNEGEKLLVKASKYSVVAYPLAGALIGTCVGGPIGLIAGLKIGGLTALGCGILGFTGGSLLKKREIVSKPSDESIQKSTSLPESLKEDKKEL